MNKERLRLERLTYEAPEVNLLNIKQPLSFLAEGFSSNVDGEVGIDDIEDMGEL